MPIVSSDSGDMRDKIDKDAEKRRHDLLLKVYDASLAEYRFNVQLNWDRTKFYIGLAVSALAAGTAILKLATESAVASLLLMVFFFIQAAVTSFGYQAVLKGKNYSRQAVLTKTLVERELGLFKEIEGFQDPGLHLGIAVTPGQRNFLKILFDRKTRSEKKPDQGSIIERTQWIFVALITIQLLFGIASWFSFASLFDVQTSKLRATNDSRERFSELTIFESANLLLPLPQQAPFREAFFGGRR